MSIFSIFGIGRDAVYQQRIAGLEISLKNVHEGSRRLREKIAQRDDELRSLRRRLEECATAAEELEEAWRASPYPGNRKHVTMAEHVSALGIEIEQERDKAATAERARKMALLQVQAFRDAVELLASRAEASPEELAQLGLGTLIPGDRSSGKPDTFVFGDLEDAKDSVDFAMKNQATVAKFRQLKDHFVKHQQAVTIILDQISAITRKNAITAEDHNKLRSMRDALSSLIGRAI